MGQYSDSISRLLRKPTLAAIKEYLGIGAGGPVTEADLSFSDITTANSTAAQHGLLPKLSGNAGEFLAGDGSWTPAAGGGTVTSVAITTPSILSVAGSPITGAGTLALTLANQSANLVFSGPSSGGAAPPTFRSLVEADTTLSDITTNDATAARHGYLPKLSGSATDVLDGTGVFRAEASGSGTVTSVALTMPTAIFDVAGSPVTTAGTLAVTLDNQNANLVFAGPTSGGAAAPAFRALVADDIPAAARDWDVVITKSIDQTVTNNATPQNDSELSTPLAANSFYLVQLLLLYSGNDVNGDYRGRFTHPAIPQAGASYGFLNKLSITVSTENPVGAGSGNTTQWPTNPADIILGVDPSDAKLVGFVQFMLLIGGSGGTLQYQFANAQAGVGRTSTTRKGTTLRVKLLASAV